MHFNRHISTFTLTLFFSRRSGRINCSANSLSVIMCLSLAYFPMKSKPSPYRITLSVSIFAFLSPKNYLKYLDVCVPVPWGNKAITHIFSVYWRWTFSTDLLFSTCILSRNPPPQLIQTWAVFQQLPGALGQEVKRGIRKHPCSKFGPSRYFIADDFFRGERIKHILSHSSPAPTLVSKLRKLVLNRNAFLLTEDKGASPLRPSTLHLYGHLP